MTRDLTLLVVFCFAGLCGACSEVYIPSTSDHARCSFKDGSYFEYRFREKWYFYAELIPADVTTRVWLDRSHIHSDLHGKVTSDVGFVSASSRAAGSSVEMGAAQLESDMPCATVGKNELATFTTDGYQIKGQPWKRFVKTRQEHELGHSIIPVRASSIIDNPDTKQRAYLDENYLHANPRRFFIVPLSPDGKRLLFEQPVIALNHPKAKFGTLMTVYQAVSEDWGISWSNPVFTQDAKLFALGRSEKEQPWGAKVTACWSRSTGGDCIKKAQSLE